MAESANTNTKKQHFSLEDDQYIIAALSATKGNVDEAMKEMVDKTKRKKSAIMQHLSTKNFKKKLAGVIIPVLKITQI